MLAAVIVAEIGDIRRFRHPGQLGCWAGLTPRHRESDAKVTRGHISKMVCAGGMVPRSAEAMAAVRARARHLANEHAGV